MTLICPLCKGKLEVYEDLVEGQHVLCPYCNGKFSYAANDNKCGVTSAKKLNTKESISMSKGRHEASSSSIKEKNISEDQCQESVSVLGFLAKSFFVWLKAFKLSTKTRCGRIEYGMVLTESLFCFTCACVWLQGMDRYRIITVERMTGHMLPVAFIVVTAIGGISLLLLVVVAVRRLHDNNRSGWWLMALLAPAIICSWCGHHSLENALFILASIVPLFLPSVESGNRFEGSRTLNFKCRKYEYAISLFLWPVKFACLLGAFSYSMLPMGGGGKGEIGNSHLYEAKVDYSKMSNAEFRSMMMKKKINTMIYLKEQKNKQSEFKSRAFDAGYSFALERYDVDDKLISVCILSGTTSSRGVLGRGLEDGTLVYPRWLPFREAQAIWNALEIDWDSKIRKAEIEFDERMMVLRDEKGILVDRDAIRAEIAAEHAVPCGIGYRILPESAANENQQADDKQRDWAAVSKRIEEMREQEEKAKNRSPEEIKKDKEAAKKRHDAEQKERASYAAKKLGEIRFGYKHRLYVTEAVRKTMTSFRINETIFSTVQKLIMERKYLEALSEICEKALADYPDSEAIDSIIQGFLKKPLHAEMKFGRKAYPVVCLSYDPNEHVTGDLVRNRSNWVFDRKIDNCGDGRRPGWVFEISLGDKNEILVFDCPPNVAFSDVAFRGAENLSRRIDEIEEKLKNGKINQHEADALMVSAYKKAVNRILGKVSPLENAP